MEVLSSTLFDSGDSITPENGESMGGGGGKYSTFVEMDFKIFLEVFLNLLKIGINIDMKIIDIVEARKNPELNPRKSPDEQLIELASQHRDSSVFVRLSGIAKFGANPTAEYETTPLGIYGYPVDYAIEDGIDSLPYPQPGSPQARYVVVFKLTHGAVVWDLSKDDPGLLRKVREACGTLITHADALSRFEAMNDDRDADPNVTGIESIREWFLQVDKNEDTLDELEAIVDEWWAGEIEKNWPKNRARVIRNALPDELADDGYDPANEDDAEEMSIIMDEALEDPDSEYSKKMHELYVETEWADRKVMDGHPGERRALEKKWLEANDIKTMGDVFRFFDYAIKWPYQINTTTSKGLWEWIKTESRWSIEGGTPIVFRKILLKAGIDAVIDPGFGIIHENEPTQAVFFTSNKVKQIGLIDKDRTGLPLRIVHGAPTNDTTRAQWMAAIRNGTYGISKVPPQFLDYRMILTAVTSGHGATVRALPATLTPVEYLDLVARLVAKTPNEIQHVDREKIPADNYIALWKAAMIQHPMIWRVAPPDIKDTIMPGHTASVNTEVNRVKELAEKLNR